MRHHHARPPQLARKRRMILYGIAAGTWATGALWVVCHYFLMSEGPFGLTPHPLEFWSLASHGAFAFASLWLLGLLWAVHIPIGWRTSRRRWSGGAMLGVSGWLVLSGYALYYVGSEELMSISAILHWSVGLAAPALFLLHRFAREPKRVLAENIHDLDIRIRQGSR